MDPPISHFHDNFTDLIFKFSVLLVTLLIDPPQYVSLSVSLSVAVQCLCKVISKDLL